MKPYIFFEAKQILGYQALTDRVAAADCRLEIVQPDEDYRDAEFVLTGRGKELRRCQNGADVFAALDMLAVLEGEREWAADEEHREKIIREVVNALAEKVNGVDLVVASMVANTIADGAIPHVAMQF